MTPLRRLYRAMNRAMHNFSRRHASGKSIARTRNAAYAFLDARQRYHWELSLGGRSGRAGHHHNDIDRLTELAKQFIVAHPVDKTDKPRNSSHTYGTSFQGQTWTQSGTAETGPTRTETLDWACV